MKHTIDLPAQGHGDRAIWLTENFGERDPQLSRWEHHCKKGELRRHWDRKAIFERPGRTPAVPTHIRYIFTRPDMLVLFKLTWAGR